MTGNMEKAVALKYNTGLPAPFILAKGKGEIANKIKKIASEHGVHIVDMPELVDSLIILPSGDFIPEKYYRIIAELLVFVKNIQEEE